MSQEAVVSIRPTQGKGIIVAIFKLPFKAAGKFQYGMDFKGKSMDVSLRTGTYAQTDSSTVLDFGDFDLGGLTGKAPVTASLWGYDGAPRKGGDGSVYRDQKVWFKCKWIYKVRDRT